MHKRAARVEQEAAYHIYMPATCIRIHMHLPPSISIYTHTGRGAAGLQQWHQEHQEHQEQEEQEEQETV